jgi:hypothetical protein
VDFGHDLRDRTFENHSPLNIRSEQSYSDYCSREEKVWTQEGFVYIWETFFHKFITAICLQLNSESPLTKQRTGSLTGEGIKQSQADFITDLVLSNHILPRIAFAPPSVISASEKFQKVKIYVSRRYCTAKRISKRVNKMYSA